MPFTVLRSLAAKASLLAMFALTLPAAHAQTITLRLHHFFPSSSPVQKGYFEPWKQSIEKASEGRISVLIFPSMQLGGTPPSLFDQAREGRADIVWTVLGYTPDRFPAAEVFDLPFMPSSAEATSQAAHEFAMKHLREAFADVHVIAVHTHSPGAIHTRDTPVRRLEDMRRLKIRGPSRMINRYLQALQAEPVGLPVPATPEAISRGVIQGTVMPFEGIYALGLAELTRYHTRFAGNRAIYSTPMLVAMSKRRYDSLPEDLRAIIDAHSGIKQAREIGRVMDAADQPVLTGLSGSNRNEIITLSAEETARWIEVGRQVTEDWIQAMNARGLDGQALYDEARALVEKYTAQQ